MKVRVRVRFRVRVKVRVRVKCTTTKAGNATTIIHQATIRVYPSQNSTAERLTRLDRMRLTTFPGSHFLVSTTCMREGQGVRE